MFHGAGVHIVGLGWVVGWGGLAWASLGWGGVDWARLGRAGARQAGMAKRRNGFCNTQLLPSLPPPPPHPHPSPFHLTGPYNDCEYYIVRGFTSESAKGRSDVWTRTGGMVGIGVERVGSRKG